ncbi:MAG: hypothetical protein HYS12_14785 [Planctomycetes bacterium]|nr:hypothetical protein [Planctomycetota bacterium]
MAQAALVEMQIKEGQTLIERLTHEGIEVTAAAWIKESESGDWYFYLATPLVSEGGATKAAYRRVNAVIREMEKEGFGMDPFEQKVIGPHNPIARDMVAHRGRLTRTPKRFWGSRLGNLAIEEAYIYPPPPATPEELAGIQLWECGRIELRPGIGPAGLCRVVVIDLQTQTVVQRRTYRGTMANPQSLVDGQLEVTWAEGGAVRIIGAAAAQRWRWSQPRGNWEEGGQPPDEVLQAIFTAMG